ncbi:hypothetical protein K8I28_09000 [bacterium]|nr:hypothetical protein [bacterium]
MRSNHSGMGRIFSIVGSLLIGSLLLAGCAANTRLEPLGANNASATVGMARLSDIESDEGSYLFFTSEIAYGVHDLIDVVISPTLTGVTSGYVTAQSGLSFYYPVSEKIVIGIHPRLQLGYYDSEFNIGSFIGSTTIAFPFDNLTWALGTELHTDYAPFDANSNSHETAIAPFTIIKLGTKSRVQPYFEIKVYNENNEWDLLTLYTGFSVAIGKNDEK